MLEPIIIVGKERSVGIITGDGSSSNPFTFIKIAFDLGIPGFRQIAQFGQVISYLTPQGVNTYDAGQRNINLASQMLTSNIRDQFVGLSSATLPNALCWYDWTHERLCYAVCSGANTYPDLIWTYDAHNGGWYQQTGFTITSAFVDTDGTVYHGDDQGNLYRHDETVTDYNGNAIVSACQTGFMDFFEPDLYKRIKHASIQVRGNGVYNMGIATQLDYGANLGSSHTVNLSNAGYVWGSGTWNSTGVYQWGLSTIKKELFFPKNIFKSIAFSFNQSGLNQPVDVFELQMEVEYLNLY